MPEEKKYSVKTLISFFGKKEGQDLTSFGAEIKALTEEEKIQICEGIEKGTLTY